MPIHITKRELDSTMRGILRDSLRKNGPGYGSAFRHMCRLYNCGDLLEDRPHQFITVALPNDYNISKILKYIHTPHKWNKGSLLSIEKYSKSGENLHIHILKEDYYSKTKIIRDLSTRFKVSGNFIDVRRGTEPADYEHRASYIKGDKMDTEKMEHVQKDKEWRKKNNLKDFYYI